LPEDSFLLRTTLLKRLQEREGRARPCGAGISQAHSQPVGRSAQRRFVDALRTLARLPENRVERRPGWPARPPLTADIIASMRQTVRWRRCLAFFAWCSPYCCCFALAWPTLRCCPRCWSAYCGCWPCAWPADQNQFHQLHCLPHHLRHRRGLRGQRHGPLRGDGGRDVGAASAARGAREPVLDHYHHRLLVPAGSQEPGLYYFGFLAVLGEITCLTVAAARPACRAAMVAAAKRGGRERASAANSADRGLEPAAPIANLESVPCARVRRRRPWRRRGYTRVAADRLTESLMHLPKPCYAFVEIHGCIRVATRFSPPWAGACKRVLALTEAQAAERRRSRARIGDRAWRASVSGAGRCPSPDRQ